MRIIGMLRLSIPEPEDAFSSEEWEDIKNRCYIYGKCAYCEQEYGVVVSRREPNSGVIKAVESVMKKLLNCSCHLSEVKDD